MNIEPKERKLDFLEGIFSSHGDCPGEKSSFSRKMFARWMDVCVGGCGLPWSVLDKHLVSHPPALSRLRGNS